MTDPLITLLTDFGLQDPYVGMMKGVIAQINPALRTIDLTHDIPPQNITLARFALMSAYPYFPDGTVHVVVVDPGVGSTRRAVAVQFERGYWVAPDNGVLSGVLDQESAIAAVELTNPQYWRDASPSTTFHGRDIFAPVGAHLASGVAIAELGQTIDPNTLIRLEGMDYSTTDDGITGRIQSIDRFGNLITTIPGSAVTGREWTLQICDRTIQSHQTYGDVTEGETIALIGSHGWIEIAVNSGSAQSLLNASLGDVIQIP